MEEVGRLQEHVAELGVRDAGALALEPRTHGVLLDHLIHGEVLAHVAEEVEEAQRLQPFGVVDQNGPPRTSEVEELLELGPHAFEVGLDLLGGEEVALLVLPTRIADESGRATGHGNGPVPRSLEPAQVAQLQHVADVQAVGRRVEPAVTSQGVPVEASEQARIRRLVDEATEFEIGGEPGHARQPATSNLHHRT